MAKKEKFVFEELAGAEVPKNDLVQSPFSFGVKVATSPASKITFDCDNDLIEQMKDYGYWEGLSLKEIIIDSLKIYFKGRDIQPRPDKVKNRTKVGRKPKIPRI